MCDCTFNDDLAKELHLKGRRHRLNYKKNYDPSLKVRVYESFVEVYLAAASSSEN